MTGDGKEPLFRNKAGSGDNDPLPADFVRYSDMMQFIFFWEEGTLFFYLCDAFHLHKDTFRQR